MPLQVVGSSLMKQTGLSVREFVMRVAPPFAIKFSEINHQTGIKVVPVHFWWGTRITLRHWLLQQPHSHYLAVQLGQSWQTNKPPGSWSTEYRVLRRTPGLTVLVPPFNLLSLLRLEWVNPLQIAGILSVWRDSSKTMKRDAVVSYCLSILCKSQTLLFFCTPETGVFIL